MSILIIIFGIIIFILILFLIISYFITDTLEGKYNSICETSINIETPELNPLPDRYDQASAYNLMVLSLQTTLTAGCGNKYEAPSEFTVIPIMGFDPFAGINRQFATYYYSSVKKMQIITFAGTTYPSEWYDDADISQIAPINLGNYESGILVHRGFYNIYNNMRQKIIDLLNTVQQETQIIIAGHSLGGGLASLCYFDLQKSYNDAFLYTFAAPRVGNILYAEFLTAQKKVYRIFNTEDLIPSLPPPILGNLLYEQNEANIVFTDNLGTYTKNHTNAYLKYLSS